MTIKTLTYPTPGPVALSVETVSAAVQVRIDDVERAVVTISTTAINGPSSKAVNEAILEPVDGRTLKVRVREGVISTGGIVVNGRSISISGVAARGSIVMNGDNVYINGVPMSGASVGETRPIVVHAVLPIGSSVSVETTSGGIALHGSVDDLIAESVSGEINVEQAISAAIKTVSGAITIEKVTSCGAKTVSGRIRIDNALGKVKAKTTSGAITIAYSGWEVPETKTTSGRVAVSRLAVEDRR